METLAELVRRIRKDMGLKQSALAKLVAVDSQTISNLETGKTQGTNHLPGLALALKIDVSQLVEAERFQKTLGKSAIQLRLWRAKGRKVAQAARISYADLFSRELREALAQAGKPATTGNNCEKQLGASRGKDVGP